LEGGQYLVEVEEIQFYRDSSVLLDDSPVISRENYLPASQVTHTLFNMRLYQVHLMEKSQPDKH